MMNIATHLQSVVEIQLNGGGGGQSFANLSGNTDATVPVAILREIHYQKKFSVHLHARMTN